MDYFDPSEAGIDDLVKRVRVGEKTKEFVSTPTGNALISRALIEYRNGIELLQDMSLQGYSGSPEEELNKYRKMSDKLSSPVKILRWMDGIIADGDTAASLIKHKGSQN
jgi:hypothetical protein|tara:strand:+ start:268 stop:594 length:327 start_codon:yes stop_codon:yes gene_type:complete